MSFAEELFEAMQLVEFDARQLARQLVQSHRLFFVGNGGSAAIASHMANDFSKNGNMPALAFNDGASLTCLANDLGYENVFAHPLDKHIKGPDCLVAISSSGKSPSIIHACHVAKAHSADVVTFSGFDADNPLRNMGSANYYVPSADYGIVETAHLAMLHAALRELPHARQ